MVYRALDEHLDCDVAMKVLPVNLLTDEAGSREGPFAEKP